MDIPLADGTFAAFKLACNNTISADEHFWVYPRNSIIIKSNLKRSTMTAFAVGTWDSEILSLTIGN